MYQNFKAKGKDMKRSLFQKLFRTYVGGFIIYLGVLFLISLGVITVITQRDFAKTQQQLMMSISENVSNYFEEMDAFSMELSNSMTFKSIAVKELPQAFEEGRGTVVLFSDLYQNAYKMIQKGYRVGVVADDQYYVWMGEGYHIGKISEKCSTYENLTRDETAVVKYLPCNEYLNMTNPKASKEQAYITLSRSMSLNRPFLNGQDILEIQVEAEEFANSIAEMLEDVKKRDIRLDIFDTDGQKLYGESNQDLSEYVDCESGTFEQKKGKQIQVEKIFDGRLTIVYSMNRNAYLGKLGEIWFLALIVIVGITAGAVYMTWRISKQTSKPLYEMCEHVRDIDLEKGKGYKPVETDVEEIEFLSNSLQSMSEDLEGSMHQILAMKDYELHAKMLALQAQMHPHFLFNTLMTIATMAEKSGNDGIYHICMNLTSMFRYISAESTEGVRVFEEIRHVEQYVEIMKERFPDGLVEVDIPLEMMEERIPKLTIQPLVENAFKYCNRQRPVISVKGKVSENGSWFVAVTDNGAGFSAETKADIMKKCEESMENEKILSNQIDGMGLVNVYIRLKLFYGEEMYYMIEENRGRIEIGRCRKSNGEQK